nr:MAG TPA: hypothetical protein [Caudoviricetes sp.]
MLETIKKGRPDASALPQAQSADICRNSQRKTLTAAVP